MKKDIENRGDIILLVNTFYDRVKQNELLDHVFTDVAKMDWDSHLPKMYDFWESIVFKNAVYSGNPMRVHKQLHFEKIGLTKEMFDQWLTLFNLTVDDLFEGANALEAKTRARSIATMISLKTTYSDY